MGKNTRRLTISALFAALAVVALFVASVWPTGQYGLAAVASLFVAAAVIEAGALHGVYVFIVSSALGMLLLPDKSAPLLFLVFFGYYPILKNLIERIGNAGDARGQGSGVRAQETGDARDAPRSVGPILAVQWVLKLLVFNAALTVIMVFLKEMLLGFGDRLPGAWVLYLLGSAVFALYDYGYSKVLWLYINRISKQLGTGDRKI